MSARRTPIVILGAGPAGLAAAYRLSRRGCFDVTVLERQALLGGNAASFDVAGLQVDFGSHRLHPSCRPDILNDIRGFLGEDLLNRPRHGRIRLCGRWVHFPPKPVDLARHLPLSFNLGVGADALRKLTSRPRAEDSFADVLERGLGRTICKNFYFPYARKIWGLDPEELDPEQARRRVSAGSLGKMVRKVLNAVPGMKPPGAGRFFYPKRGFGSICEAYAQAARTAGATIRLNTTVSGIEVEQGRATGVHVMSDGALERIPAKQVLSTIPVSALAHAVNPQPPEPLLRAACQLRSRAMILIYLVLETEQFTGFDAHYFPDANIAITRLSEPKNYGLASLPGRTVLCAELPCTVGDRHWTATDATLGQLVRDALESVNLPVSARIAEIVTRRLPQAYPLYTRDYRAHFDQLDQWIGGVDGLLTFGRQGLFAHDNTHHALAMAYALDECLDDAGTLNMPVWQAHRREFTRHVVED